MIKKQSDGQQLRDSNVVGNRLHQLRLEKGYTLNNLSKKLDDQISANLLGKYERNVPNSSLGMLADFYDVDIDYLLGLTDIRNASSFDGIPSISEEEKKLIIKFRKCDQKTKDFIFMTFAYFPEDY